MTLPTLAKAVCASHQSVRYWLDGRASPAGAQLLHLEDALDSTFHVTQDPLRRGRVYSPLPKVAEVLRLSVEVHAAVESLLGEIEAGGPLLGARMAADSLDRTLVLLADADRCGTDLQRERTVARVQDAASRTP